MEIRTPRHLCSIVRSSAAAFPYRALLRDPPISRSAEFTALRDNEGQETRRRTTAKKAIDVN